MSFIEGVQTVSEAVAEDDRFPADCFGDGGVLAFRVTGDVYAPPERNRACVEALRERRFPGADDPGEDDVRGGDQPASVEAFGFPVLPEVYMM